jgi:hypothetical protein
MKQKKSNQIQTEKTGKKPELNQKTDPNRFEHIFVLKKPNQTETGLFEPVFV